MTYKDYDQEKREKIAEQKRRQQQREQKRNWG
jgi:hypothetical protein